MIGTAVKGALRWMMLAKGVSQAVSWLVTIIVIRILSPADYGLYTMASMLVVLAEMLKELGLGSALVQAKDLAPLMLRQVYTVVLLVNILLYVVVATTAPLMASFFDENALLILIPVLALQFPVTAFETIPDAMLAREMDFRSKALIATAGAVANSITTLTCAVLGMGVWSLVYGTLVAAVVRMISYAMKQSIYYTPTMNFSGVGNLITFGGYVTVSRLLNVLLIQSSFMVVGRILGKEALGIFSVANQLATLPMQKVSGILNEIGLAAFSKIQLDRAKVAAHYITSMSILSFLAFPTFWGLASVAESLTTVVLGSKWMAIVLPLQLIAFITPFRMIFNTTTPALLGIGRADIFFTNLLYLNVLMPVACVVGSPWGVNGVSMAWLLTYPPIFLFVQRRSLKCLDVDWPDLLAAIRMSALVALAMSLVVLLVRSWILADHFNSLISLAMQVLVGAAIYAGLSIRYNFRNFSDTKVLIYK